MTMNQEPRAPISSPTTAGPTCGKNDSARDYITVEDILREMADGVANGEAATVLVITSRWRIYMLFPDNGPRVDRAAEGKEVRRKHER